MEQVQQELIRSNEMLATQVWVLGGLISFLLMVLIYFAKASYTEIKDMLHDHEVRLQTVEKNERDTTQILKFTTDDVHEHKRLMDGLTARIDRTNSQFKAD